MIWVDREANRIAKRELPLEWVDDMKTPSGRIHVGSLRGVVIHDLLYKALLDAGAKTKFTYVFDDHDPMDAIPSYLDKKKWEKYSGLQLFNVPSPEPGFKSFADYYAKEFISVFNSINCHPEIIWGSDLYKSGKMNDVITEILNNVNFVKTIYEKMYKKKLPKDWYPFNPVCENCKKIGTTKVFKWDGKYVHYRCELDMVVWAKGCGHEGKISPFDGNGKLTWKVEWAAKWKVIGITVEGAGKDHISAGGSHDIASEICRKVLHYPIPHPVTYEFFIIGGKKMSSSKGLGSSSKEVSQILPPELLRFLMVRTPIERTIDFQPEGDTIPSLFDEYDRCLAAYFDKLENKIPEGKTGEVLNDFARIAELSEVRPLPKKRLFLPRFRTVASHARTKGDVLTFFEEQKGSKLTAEEREILEERVVYAQVYLKNYANPEDKIQLTKDSPKDLTIKQKDFLNKLAENIEKKKDPSREDLQQIVFDTLKRNSFQAKEVFSAFYKALLGREHGPKAADLILEFGIDKVVARLKDINIAKNNSTTTSKSSFTNKISKKIFSIDSRLKKTYPSIHIGVAIIKNVRIEKASAELKKRTDAFIKQHGNLTNEILSAYPEIQSYRKLYKATGIDWHSRRPSPEALLRRIALKKGLYSVNNVVDAYNLVVMNSKVSVGAFDLDNISFPTILRFAKKDEKILLLGDKVETTYKEGEIAYFDKKGGYNIDFNYRDAQRTAVTEKTKSLYINVDGVFDITKRQVENALQDSIRQILQYAGGTVETVAVI